MFKVGDRVRCIDDSLTPTGRPPPIRAGEVYTIYDVVSRTVMLSECRGWGLYPDRFELVKSSVRGSGKGNKFSQFVKQKEKEYA